MPLPNVPRASEWIETTRAFEWLSIAALLLCVDFVTGPYINFPITYIIPVSMAAWYAGFRPAISLALLMPTVRVFFSFLWPAYATPFDIVSSVIIRVLVLGSFAFVMAQLAEKRRLLAARVEVLEGILPICSFCKRIRDDAGAWQPVESYVARRSHASFSHGFCDDCMTQHYGEGEGDDKK
jgi:hypothetical protein